MYAFEWYGWWMPLILTKNGASWRQMAIIYILSVFFLSSTEATNGMQFWYSSCECVSFQISNFNLHQLQYSCLVFQWRKGNTHKMWMTLCRGISPAFQLNQIFAQLIFSVCFGSCDILCIDVCRPQFGQKDSHFYSFSIFSSVRFFPPFTVWRLFGEVFCKSRDAPIATLQCKCNAVPCQFWIFHLHIQLMRSCEPLFSSFFHSLSLFR